MKLRGKVKYADRAKYVWIISRLEGLSIYTKLGELKACKTQWGDSSAALQDVFRDIAVPFIQIHTDDLVLEDYLSDSTLKEVSELCCVPVTVLALELIALFAAPDSHWPASIWMNLAAIICEKAKLGEGQIALEATA